jgi:hypothetical protein
MLMFYVYTYRDPDEKLPFYVGKGKNDRKYKHLKETKENTENYLKWCKIQSILNKNKFPIIEEVFETDIENEAYEYEKKIIQKYGRKGLDDGGILTNRCLDNRPPTYAGSLPRSDEYLFNMSMSKIGDKNPMYGKDPWNKGLSTSNITKQKISKANTGRKYTEEEHISRNKSRGKTYKIYSPDNVEYVVKNLKEWCEQNNFNYCSFREAIMGYKGKTNYKGWTGELL